MTPAHFLEPVQKVVDAHRLYQLGPGLEDVRHGPGASKGLVQATSAVRSRPS